MTVLSLPALLMLNDSTIAALSSGHRGFPCNSDGDVIYPIPDSDNSSGCGSKNLDAFVLNLEIGNPDIRSVMPVIGAATATIVASLVGIFMVNIILHETSHAQFAPYGKGKRDDFYGLTFDTGGKANRR